MPRKPERDARDALRAELIALAGERLSLREFADACLEELRKAISFELAAVCILPPEAHYEQVVSCWPAWAADALNGRTFSTEEMETDRLKNYPDGVGYSAESRPGPVSALAVAREAERLWCIPLMEDDEYFGSITIGRGKSGRFSPEERELAAVAAASLKAATRREIELTRAQLSIQRAAALSTLAIMVNAGDRLEEFYEHAMPVLRGVLHIDFAMLKLLDPETGEMRVVASDLPHFVPSGEADWYPRERIQALMASGQRLTEFNPAEIPTAAAARLRDLGFARGTMAPLTRDGELLGILLIARHADWSLTETERAFIELFSALCSQVIVANRRMAAASAETQEQRFIADLAEAVAAASTPQVMLSSAQRVLAEFVPGALVNYGYLDGDEILSPFSAVDPPRRLKVGPYIRSAIEQGQFVPPRGTPAALAGNLIQVDRPDVGMVAITAALAGGTVAGVLSVRAFDDAFQFSERELRIFRVAARIIGPAMENVRKMTLAVEEAAEERIIADIARAAAAATSPTELVAGLAEPFSRIVPEPRVGFGYRDGDSIVFPSARYQQDLRFPVTEYLAEAFETGQCVMPQGAQEWSPANVASPQPVTTSAVALTAAQSGGLATGILAVRSSRNEVEFSPRQLHLFRLLANIVGPAMANVRSAELAREEAAEQRMVADMAALAAREADPRALGLALRAALPSFVPRPSAGLASVSNGTVRFFSDAGETEVILTESECEAFAAGQAVRTNPSFAALHHPLGNPPFAAMALTRMGARGDVVEALWVTSREPGYRFTPRMLRHFRVLADIFGPALANARATVELARENALHQLVLNSVSEAVVLFDRNLGVAFANDGGTILRRAVDPLEEAASIWEVAERLPVEARRLIATAVSTRERTRGRSEYPIDGEPHWFDYENIPLDHPDFGMLLVASDVTAEVLRGEEQRRHRQQLDQSARLAALGELVGGVAHELNNPLTAILGFSEVISEQSQGAAFSEELEIIRHEATRARDIVRDLLSFARPSEAQRTPVEMADILAHVSRLRRAHWDAQGIRATVDHDRDAGRFVGDPQQITQVVLNLVTNAEHALRGRKDPQLEIRASGEGSRITVTVTDNGIGMDQDTIGRIFEPFFSTKQGDGTGLGLSLSYSIIKSHNGTLEVESEPGWGTRFTLVLPAGDGKLSTPADARATPRERHASVLVIDDEPNVRRLCQRLIAAMGHDCEVAGSVGSALEAVSRRPFDLIVCDYRLGSETADAIVDQIHHSDPGLVQRIVIATGATTETRVLELCERHRLRLIEKPYGSKEIAKLVAAA